MRHFTKKYPPPIHQELLCRGRVESFLNNYTLYSSIFFLGMAGAGKTAALQHWLLNTQPHSLYLTPNGSLNTPKKLIDYLLENTQAENLSKTGENEEKKCITQGENILSDYADWLCPGQTQLICIWDMGAHPWSDILIQFITHQIKQPSKKIFHIVLSRHPWPTADLQQLQQEKQQLKIIDLTMLKFSEQEFDAALASEPNLYQNIHQWTDPIKDFYEKAHGWPIMLYFFKNFLSNTISLQQPSLAEASLNYTITHYIKTHLLDRLDEESRYLLHHLAMLPSITLELCAKILMRDKAQYITSFVTLEKLGFIIQITDQQWKLTQPLLHDFFEQAWLKQTPQLLTALYNSAGQWYEANGMIHHAIEIYIKLKNWQTAIALIEKHAAQLAQSQDWQQITRWITQLPAETIHAKTEISSLNSSHYISSLKHKNLPLIFSSIHSDVPPPKSRLSDKLAPMHLDQEISYLSNISNAVEALSHQITHPIPPIQQASSATQYSPINNTRVMTKIFLTAIRQLSLEQFYQAHQTLKTLTTTAVSQINPSFAFNGLFLMSFTSHRLGQFKEMIELCEKINQWADEHHHHDHSLSPWLQGSLCIISIEMNNLSLAEFYLSSMKKLIQEDVDPVHKFFVYYIQANIAIGKLNYDAAWEAIDTAETYLNQVSYNFIESLTSITHLKIKVLLLKDELEQAKSLLLHTAEQHKNHQHKVSIYNKVLYAHYMISDNKEKNLRFNEIIDYASNEKDMHLLTYHYALSAYLHYRQGEHKAAHLHLEKAVALCEEYGYVRTLLDFGKWMGLLLIESCKKSPLSAIKTQLHEAIKKEPYYEELNTEIVQLSKREKEVLRLIAAGYSNEKISETLYRSLGTIKLHVHNIYKKMGVANRLQAIKKYHSSNFKD